MPAPPPESEPAMVRATFTLVSSRSRAVSGLGWRGRQRVHRALQLVKHGCVLAAGLRGGAGGRVRCNRPFDVGDAIGGHGGGREELLQNAGGPSPYLLQNVKHLGEPVPAASGSRGVPHPRLVRPPPVLAAAAREDR